MSFLIITTVPRARSLLDAALAAEEDWNPEPGAVDRARSALAAAIWFEGAATAAAADPIGSFAAPPCPRCGASRGTCSGAEWLPMAQETCSDCEDLLAAPVAADESE